MRLNAIKILCIYDGTPGRALRSLAFKRHSILLRLAQLRPTCVDSAVKSIPTLRIGTPEQSTLIMCISLANATKLRSFSAQITSDSI